MQTKSNTARNEILGKIKKGQEKHGPFSYNEPDWDSNIYKEIEGASEECFVKELAELNGNSILCSSDDEIYAGIKKVMTERHIDELYCITPSIADKLQKYEIAFTNDPAKFPDMQAGITYCECLVARTGSVMVSSASESGRQMNIYPPIHIVIANKSQLVPYVGDALALMKERYGNELPSTITNITGPSRTADIEKTLVLGAHGPKEFWVLINVNE